MANYSDGIDQQYNLKDEHEIHLKDMPRTVIVYRLSVYFSLCLTVSSLYLPVMKPQHNPRRNRHFSDSFSGLASSHRSTDHDISSWNKRASVYKFSNVMTRHAGRHKNDKAFVDKMFSLFDLNKNRKIEYEEFKVVLQILQIVSHNF